MKILVTGGCGFLGAYIILALKAEGHNPIAYDYGNPSKELEYLLPELANLRHCGDISDQGALASICEREGIEAIVHAASRVGFESSLADPKGYYQTNIMGFVNVCEAARAASVGKVVLISSNSVYHKGAGSHLSECECPFSISRGTPAAHYGTSKMASEAIGMAYAEFHGVDFIALRVTAIYGFGMRHAIHVKPMVENAIQNNKTTFATGGRMARDYTHVLDCADAALAAVVRPTTPKGAPRILNVSAGRLVTGSELARTVASVLPEADIEIGDLMGALEAENVKMRAPLDCTLAHDELGWRPKWTLVDGIRQYANKYREYIRAVDS